MNENEYYIFPLNTVLFPGGRLPLTTHVSHGLGHSIDPAGLRLGAEFLKKVLPQPRTWSSGTTSFRLGGDGKAP